jgi:cysteinyl-tRNA synthetase
MHNGFVRVDDEKMSKSLGNFFTIREVLQVYDPEVLRFFILRAHYRSPLNYSDAHLNDARQALTRLYTALKGAPSAAAAADFSTPMGKRFKEAMDDDFGTPDAIAVLHELANDAFQNRPGAAAELRALGGLLGLLQRDADAFLKAGPGALPAEAIEALIERRKQARARKDFSAADDIRRNLLDQGVVLEDGPAGTTWRRT